ncbi:class II fructose-bisphosphate aldolase [Actinoplanes aureus]|uniref:Class II fructose-bisphosphate aldolase n=1 Tax=Actinoplanes aureus TaxID=2792083 RepID=A0A931C9D7_9ACTN|nr:class II fructose-bisphosphate aldolase [Actinoplanes aureus]MBG0563792.1 class II fructose-bisphosphate aldolase [Actinoplanes aureus]
MPLVNIADIITPAAMTGRPVGAFNVVQLEHAEAIVAGAERAQAPVVLQISENCARYHGALAPIGAATLAVARVATVPVAVHLDHATTADLVREAVRLGFGSVMYDASALGHDANIAATRDVTGWCHRHDVWVEAELGEIGGKDGVHAPGVRTDPADAAAYVQATGVDALAVAVGSSHAMLTRDAVLDLDLIAEIHAAVPVPLVLHGSSGVPDTTLTAAARRGMTKINLATHLNKVFTTAIRDHLTREQHTADPRAYGATGRAALSNEVTRLLTKVLV